VFRGGADEAIRPAHRRKNITANEQSLFKSIMALPQTQGAPPAHATEEQAND
jgi:hypothetical protein